jgi:hypothetical protein
MRTAERLCDQLADRVDNAMKNAVRNAHHCIHDASTKARSLLSCCRCFSAPVSGAVPIHTALRSRITSCEKSRAVRGQAKYQPVQQRASQTSRGPSRGTHPHAFVVRGTRVGAWTKHPGGREVWGNSQPFVGARTPPRLHGSACGRTVQRRIYPGRAARHRALRQTRFVAGVGSL